MRMQEKERKECRENVTYLNSPFDSIDAVEREDFLDLIKLSMKKQCTRVMTLSMMKIFNNYQ